jgi:hypothetical protein
MRFTSGEVEYRSSSPKPLEFERERRQPVRLLPLRQPLPDLRQLAERLDQRDQLVRRTRLLREVAVARLDAVEDHHELVLAGPCAADCREQRELDPGRVQGLERGEELGANEALELLRRHARAKVHAVQAVDARH